MNETIQFFGGQFLVECFNITVTTDRLVENDESFTLLMTSADSAVMLEISEVEVRLVDSDGTSIYYLILNLLHTS